MCGKQEQGEAEEPPNYEQEDAHVKTIQQFQKREEDLIRQISRAIEDLQLHNVYVTQKGIARYLKITIGGLKYYPRAKGHLERAVSMLRRTNSTNAKKYCSPRLSLLFSNWRPKGNL